jgi:hypothetical protein
MSYNDTVSAIRLLARDELRMKAVNRMRAGLLDVVNSINAMTKNHEEETAYLNKKLAVLSFKTASLVDADPEKADKLEAYERDTVFAKRQIEENAKHFALRSEDLAKDKAEWEAKIADLESGKTLICKDSLDEVASRLIEEVVTEAAKGLKAQVSQEKAV